MAYQASQGAAFRQGDILTGVRTFSLRAFDANGNPTGNLLYPPYSVIVSQDCDLEQDYKARFPQAGAAASADKLLFGVLLCGAHEQDSVRAGQHRPQAKAFGKREWNPVVL